MCRPTITRRALLTAGFGALAGLTLTSCSPPNPVILAAGAGGAQAGPGGGFYGSCSPGPDGNAAWQTARALPSGATPEIIAEQASNVDIMLEVCREYGVTRTGLLATLICAFTESYALTDLSGFMGWPQDHTSLGIYQQQDWWGTREERLDPRMSTVLWLEGKPGIPGLLDYDYESMDPWTVAQEVQRSAYPDRYQSFMDVATAILNCGDAQIVVSGEWASPVPAGAYVTSPFGPRTTPYVGFHRGLDLDYGTGDGHPLYAATNGEVIAKLYHPNTGHTLTFQWENGMVGSYFHQSEASPLRIGDRVEVGQRVGSMGNTGYSFGSHLHFEIGTGTYASTHGGLFVSAVQDPRPFFAAQGITFPDLGSLF